MAGKGQYLVGPNQTYKTLTEAVTALQADQGALSFTTTQEIVISEAGVYDGVRIEAGSLAPTSSNRLIIRGAEDVTPVITESPLVGKTGIYVGNNVPYVSIRHLDFSKLDYSIVFGINSHRGEVDRCFFDGAGNHAAIWCYQADECSVLNSLMVNGKHLVVAESVKGVAIAHCTLFNATGFLNEDTYLAYIDLQEDRGAGEDDTGLIYLYNNIFYSQGSYGLLVYEKDMTLIRSNYNNWYFPSTDGQENATAKSALVEIREPLDDDTVSREFVTELKGVWQANWILRSSGQDRNSISDDPALLQWKPNWAGHATPSRFSVANIGAAVLCGDASGLLPSWVDDSLLCFDIEGDTRGSFPSIGAREIQVKEDFDAVEILSDPEEDEVCDPVDALGVVSDRYRASVPTWVPKVHRGIFFSRDVRYHLFTQKVGLALKDTLRTTWKIASLIEPEGIEVHVSGEDVTDSATWEIDGYTFTLHHFEVETSDTDVILKGFTKYWDNDECVFVKKPVEHRFQAEAGLRTYVLPSNPEPGQPIVVTDDLLSPSDSLALAQEFGTRYDPERDLTFLEFGGTDNRWKNPDFAYMDTGATVTSGDFTGDINVYAPEQHEFYSDGTFGVARRFDAGATHPEHLPLRAGQALLMGTGESWVGQRVPVDPDEAYVLSAYGSALSYDETGGLNVEVRFYDWDNVLLETHGPFAVSFPPATSIEPEWKRFGLSIAANADETPGRPNLSEGMEVVSGRLSTPALASRALIQFKRGDGAAVVALDAIQFEEGYDTTAFTRIPRSEDLTIEYEGGDGLFYKIDDLNLQPMRHGFNSGFLSILPLSARIWDKNANEKATTLSDYKWGWGRTNLLPWARLDGFNKYHRRVWFSTDDRREPMENVTLTPPVAYPKVISATPSRVLSTQDSLGAIFSVEAYDDEDNPYAFEHCRVTVTDTTGEFPGYLSRTEWAYPVELGQSIRTELNEAGTQVFRWLPPGEEDVTYRGDQPLVQDHSGGAVGGSYGYIRTRYEVSPRGHGNPVLKDQFGVRADLEGARVTGGYLGQYHEDGKTRIQLSHYPTPGSVEVWGSQTGNYDVNLHEMWNSPLFDRHFEVNYEQAVVVIPGDWDKPFKIGLTPSLVWTRPDYARRLYFAKEALDQVSGDLVVYYDAIMDIHIEALPPRGQPYQAPLYKKIRAIAQHPEREALWQ